VLDAVTGVPYLDDSMLGGSSALPDGCHSAVLQTGALDSQWYVMHTAEMLRDSAVRVRRIRQDNAPDTMRVGPLILARPARLFQENDEAAFRKSLEAAGVTHIVIPSWAGLASAKDYKPPGGGPSPDSRDSSFLDRLVNGQEHPAWLQEMPTRLPEIFGMTRTRIKIYRVLVRPTTAP